MRLFLKLFLLSVSRSMENSIGHGAFALWAALYLAWLSGPNASKARRSHIALWTHERNIRSRAAPDAETPSDTTPGAVDE